MPGDEHTRETFWVKQKEKKDKKYAIKEVPTPEYLDENEKKVLHHLSKAVDAVNPIYVDQVNPEYRELSRFLSDLKENVSPDAAEKIETYEKGLMIQNGPYYSSNNKSLVLDIPEEEIQQAISEGDSEELQRKYERFQSILLGEGSYDGRGNFYPEDLEKKELKEIENGKEKNTQIVKGEEGVAAVPNEAIYQNWIESEIIPNLEKAAEVSKDEKLIEYLNSKVKELKTGEKDDRHEAHRKWLELGSQRSGKVDLILGLSDEKYEDKFEGIKGSAEAILMTRNEAETEKWEKIRDLLPVIEDANTYSGEYKKSEEDFDLSSDLLAYDVLRWSGDVVEAKTMVGKSWPDEGDFGRKQMIFDNVFELSARERSFEKILREEDYNQIKGHANTMVKTFINLHEQGHSTGRDEEISKENFGNSETLLEESRASLVAINSVPLLREKDIIENEDLAYRAMVGRFGKSLRYEPVEDHIKSDNLIFHFLEDRDAVERVDGRLKINPGNVKEPVEDLLRTVGNMKYEGDKEGAEELFDEFIYDDEWRKPLAERFKEIPQGRGFVFPEFKQNGEARTPESFQEQGYLRKEKV